MKLNAVLGVCVVSTIVAAQPDGAALYKKHCAMCHDFASESRAPDRETLQKRSPEAIYQSMVFGTMVAQAGSLREEDKRALSEFLAGRPFTSAQESPDSDESGKCAKNPPLADPWKGPLWNGWGNGPANTRYQAAAAAGITAEQVPKLKVKWSFGFPNGQFAWASPSVASGRVFVGSDKGKVYSLDAATGCMYWSFRAGGGVRAAVSFGKIKVRGREVVATFFGDLAANAYALNAHTGELIWKTKVDDHRLARVTGSPVFEAGRLFVPLSSLEEGPGTNPNYECCTFRGNITALEGATGKILWKGYAIQDEPKPVKKNSAGTQLYHPAGAAIWSAPTVDLKRRAVYAGTGNAYTEPADEGSDAVVAFDLDTGKRQWVKQVTQLDAFLVGCAMGGRNENCPSKTGPDFDFGNAPILRELPGGKGLIVIGQKSGVLWGLDPDRNGEVVWQVRVGRGTALGGLEWGSAADPEVAYTPNSDRLRRLEEQGGLAAVKMSTGEKLWQIAPPKPDCKPGSLGCSAAQSAPAAVIPGVVFSGSIDGRMRAFSTKDGSLLWEFNTAQEFTTVNGVKARGGSIDAAGPAIAGGMLFTTSGYGLWRGLPGNVLLAFAPEETASSGDGRR